MVAYLTYISIFLHISAYFIGPIQASPVPGHSCSNPARARTTGCLPQALLAAAGDPALLAAAGAAGGRLHCWRPAAACAAGGRRTVGHCGLRRRPPAAIAAAAAAAAEDVVVGPQAQLTGGKGVADNGDSLSAAWIILPPS